MNGSRVTDAMADTAIEWFARLRADDVTDEDRTGFVSWLRGDRLHQMAFIEILGLWEDLSILRTLDFEELQPFPILWNEKERVKARLGN